MIGAAGVLGTSPGKWQLWLSYRNQHSERRFVGSQEAPDPHVAINDIHLFDLTIIYALTARYGLDVNVPVAFMNREMSARAGPVFGGRFDTQAAGLGDVAVSGWGWLGDPATNQRHNVSLGLGVKMPTGKDGVTDDWQTLTAPVVQTVDQSIQPGDGGWGITTEISAFQTLNPSFAFFSTLNYLSNPRGTNGVRTNRPRASEAIMSVPDQYLGRLGLQVHAMPSIGLWGTFAARIEGVPAHDLLGPSDGFRRPGYAVSLEPGLRLTRSSTTAFISVPIAVYRNRVKSVPDEIDNPIPKTLGNGDAAFADSFLLLGISRTF